jgi:imidazolonepropionase-like amidohydrolase
MKRLLFCLLLIFACAPPDAGRYQAIIGALLIDGTGAPPVPISVVVTDGARIRAVGDQMHTRIPAGSQKIRGEGKCLLPALVERATRRPLEIPLEGHATPLEAIAAATRAHATPIAPGQPADLMLVAGNPLEDPGSLKRLERLMLGGVWVELR